MKPQLIRPVLDTFPVSATFGQLGRHWEPKDPVTGLGKHHGVDFACPVGTTVRAMSGGLVKEVTSTTLGGLYVAVLHGDGRRASYHHLKASLVKVGDKVTQCQPVATSGNSGTNTTGEHLHLTLRDAKGAAIDPMPEFAPTPFADIGPEHWGFTVAKWARDRLEMSGVDGELRPEEPLSTIRLLALLRRALRE